MHSSSLRYIHDNYAPKLKLIFLFDREYHWPSLFQNCIYLINDSSFVWSAARRAFWGFRRFRRFRILRSSRALWRRPFPAYLYLLPSLLGCFVHLDFNSSHPSRLLRQIVFGFIRHWNHFRFRFGSFIKLVRICRRLLQRTTHADK